MRLMVNDQCGLRANSFRAVRWTFATSVLLAFVVLLLNSTFEVCKVESDSDGAIVSKTCDGPTVSDAGVLAIALLLVLVLAPDMSEVGVLGVSLKRRLEAAEQKATDSVQRAERLESQLQLQNLRVDTLSQNVAAANAQATNNVYLVSSEEIKKIDSELPKKAEAFSRGDVPAPTVAQWSPDEENPDPSLIPRIIENWELLYASLDLGPSRRGRSGDSSPRIKVTASEADRFKFLFDEELQVVRAARNNVAHAKPITNEDLRSAVDISDQLLEILRSSSA